MNNKLKKFWDSEYAAITLEFIIVFPLLWFWFIGSIVFFDAFKCRMHATAAASTMADIVSRKDSMSRDDVLLMYNVHEALLPKGVGGWIRISSIRLKTLGTGSANPNEYEVLWSALSGSAAAVSGKAKLKAEDIQQQGIPLLQVNEEIIIFESFVPYVPIADWVGIRAKTWSTAVAISPRFTTSIPYVGDSSGES